MKIKPLVMHVHHVCEFIGMQWRAERGLLHAS